MTAPFGWVQTPYGLQRDYMLEGYIHEQQRRQQMEVEAAAVEAAYRALEAHLLLLSE